MNSLQDIFKNRPELMEDPEVKALIDHCQNVQVRNANICKSYQEFEHRVIELAMQSELVLVKGRPAKEVLSDIIELYGNN